MDYNYSYYQANPVLKADSPDNNSDDDNSILNSPLKIGLIIGGSLLFLIIVLMLAARYS